MAKYAKRLTKEDLMRGGIIGITETGLVYNKNGLVKLQINNHGYYFFTIYEFDSEGNKIKVPIKRTFKGRSKETDTYVYKTRIIPLHRAVWAWYNNEVLEGMVVDHVNNKHTNLEEDYRLSNLQLLTPQENITKERECNIKEMPCKLDRPRSYYEEKLAKYEALYKEAKANHDKEEAHKQRTNIANIKGKLRYWDTNRKEAETLMAKKKEYTEEEAARIEAKKQSLKDRKILEQYKLMFKEAGNKGMWHQMCKVIKQWDTFEQIQKDHVFDTLHRFFDKYGLSY